MTNTTPLLLEIGTEELPPKALLKLSQAFTDGICRGLEKAELSFGQTKSFATPRRISVIISALQTEQKEKQVQRRGPSLKAALDADGKPSKAALGFAKSCNVEFEDLQRLSTEKGEWLVYEATQPGRSACELLNEIVISALDQLPIPKKMRWGDSDAEFVRPVHWLLALLGEEVVPLEIFGLKANSQTRGHRFHAPQAQVITSPDRYESTLESAYVIPNFHQRRTKIESLVHDAAVKLGGKTISDTELLDEVTALVEWPVAVTGQFDSRFLNLPKEVLISTLKDHQRYFPVTDEHNELLPCFITLSNIESTQPELVQRGNERVVRPRLEDAEFFYNKDKQVPLNGRCASLAKVTFQKQLGSLEDKTQRIVEIAKYIADLLKVDSNKTARAASLCKCDLVTDLVGELPELQGTMGRYYALNDNEDESVANAIEEHYMPRFAGDAIPDSDIGRVVAIADKLDTIVGIFAIGQPPTGTKDPFGLRRNSLGVLRIIVEAKLDLDLMDLVDTAVALQPVDCDRTQLGRQVFDYMMDRLRSHYVDSGFSSEMFTAVLETRPTKPLDFEGRLTAVQGFMELDAATSLTAANKRIANILKQNDQVDHDNVDPKLLQEHAEKALYEKLVLLSKELKPLMKSGNYMEALKHLADLRQPVDDFFDGVMVMADDPGLKKNRLLLLTELRGLFLQIADLRHLQTS